MYRIVLALAAVAMAASPSLAANRCRDAKGHFIKCLPAKTAPAANKKCRGAGENSLSAARPAQGRPEPASGRREASAAFPHRRAPMLTQSGLAGYQSLHEAKRADISVPFETVRPAIVRALRFAIWGLPSCNRSAMHPSQIGAGDNRDMSAATWSDIGFKRAGRRSPFNHGGIYRLRQRQRHAVADC